MGTNETVVTPLPASAACAELSDMSSIHARLISMIAAVTTANDRVRALNNNNANNNTRIDGWAGV